MKHVGDITKLHGYDLPPVDVITGGSPCQDLSVAGKRAGMLHEANGDAETTRSGLFYDQIRIIKEMREAHVQEPAGSDQLVRGVRYPRYSIWENVPGALSAGKEKGEAFQAVLTEFVRIVEPDAPPVPMPDKGKWPTAGCLYDPMGRWSVAWRVHDLQYWGCPQRRKRLCVLCDFDGASAPWLLFDPQYGGEAEDTPPVETESDPRTEPRSEVQPLGEGLCRNSQSSQPPRQGVAEGTEDGSGGASYTLKVRGGVEVDSNGRKAGKGPLVQTELSGTLGVSQDQTLIQPYVQQVEDFCAAVNASAKHQQDLIQSDLGVARTLAPGTHAAGSHLTKTLVTGLDPSPCLNDSHQQTYVMAAGETGQGYWQPGIQTLRAEGENRPSRPSNVVVMAEGLDAYNQGATGETSMTITAKRSDPNHVPCVMAFTQNQREEIRDLEDTAGGLAAENGSHQQTYVAVDVYNQSVDGEVAASLTAASGGSNTSGPKVLSAGFKPRQGAAARSLGYEEEMSPTVNTDENYGVLCLNDQGGGVMNITEDMTNALRAQMKHHEPIVYNGETVTCPTNKQTPTAGDPCHTLTDDTRNYLVYENHSQDSRYKDLGDISETVSAKYGTGGNNQPLVLESNQNHATVTDSGIVNTLPSAMGMGGGYVPMVVDEPKAYGIDQQGGKGGANYAEDVCPAVLSDSHGTPHAVCYGIDHVVTTGGNCTAQGPCYYEETEATLKAAGPHAVAYGISAYDSNAMKSSNPHSGIYEADSARTLDLNGGSPACNQGGVAIVEPVPIEGNGQRESHRGDGYGESGDPMFTLNSTEHHAVAESYQDTVGALMASGYDKLGTQEAANDMYVVGRNWDGSETSPTLTKNNAGGNQRMPDKDNFNAVLQEGVECMQNGWYQSTGDQAPSLLARDYKDPPVVKKPKSVVRRLTPVECERLQGFPDHWTDLGEWTDSKGKKHKDADSPRYKALGNSIGLPFWQDLAARIAAQYDRPVTLGSLFDGISGFPVCFKLAGGVPVWSSEIEEFCVAVAKKHFGDDDTGEVGDFDEAIQRRHET